MSALTPTRPDGYLFPGAGHRGLALAIDCIPPLIAGYLAARRMQGLGQEAALAAAGALALFLWITNRVVAVRFTGRSLGKAITGLTIVPLDNIDAKIGIGRAVARKP